MGRLGINPGHRTFRLIDGSGGYIKAADTKSAAIKAATAIYKKNNFRNRSFIIAFKETTKTCKTKRSYRYWASVSNTGKVAVKKWRMSGGGDGDTCTGNEITISSAFGKETINKDLLRDASKICKDTLEDCECIDNTIPMIDIINIKEWDCFKKLLSIVRGEEAANIEISHIEMAIKYGFSGIMPLILECYLRKIPSFPKTYVDTMNQHIYLYPLETIDTAFSLISNTKYGFLVPPIEQDLYKASYPKLDAVRETISTFIKVILQGVAMNKEKPEAQQTRKYDQFIDKKFYIPEEWMINVFATSSRDRINDLMLKACLYLIERKKFNKESDVLMNIPLDKFSENGRDFLCHHECVTRSPDIVLNYLYQFCKIKCPSNSSDSEGNWLEREEASDEWETESDEPIDE